jgi:hypothetical protein
MNQAPSLRRNGPRLIRVGATLGVVLVIVAVIAVVLTMSRSNVPRGTDVDVGGPVGEARALDAGDRIWIGTNSLNVVTSSEVTLTRLDVLGLPSDAIVAAHYMPLAGTDGALGVAKDAELPSANRQNMMSLEGALVSAQAGYFQLVVEVVVPAGGLRVRGYLVTYEVAGMTRSEFIPHSQHVCDLATDSGQCMEFEPSE